MTTTDHRICFVGDSFVQGTGDADGLGWVGRVAADARAAGHDVTAYNLGVRGHRSADVAARWQSECAPRLDPAGMPGVVFSFGANDMTIAEDDLRVPIPDSVEQFTAIITAAQVHYRTLVVGPLPVGEHNHDVRIMVLCALYAQRAADAGVPYLPLAHALVNDPRWRAAVAAGDGTHPVGDGYALVAERVSRWPAWWFNRTGATA